MVSQFISADQVRLLGDLDYDFPEGTHAIGRLDGHSEGLLILTTNKKVTKLLFQGSTPHKRTYLVKVRHTVSHESLERLRTGVTILIRGGEKGIDYLTPPCETDIIDMPADLFVNPLETKDYIPFTWLRMTLYEGKFHQVRKMTEAINHRCKRLIRESIEDLQLGNLQAGGVREIEEEEFFRLLKIDNWQD
jgi:23S rRNA pseudouridine2457 synthase